mmetsp:Transcript_11001/g.33133  ORF Transcript_11001/g.33133 Transcript_11001/m.33133 type:complete len:107 (-) Transcript_11001:196-516(-)
MAADASIHVHAPGAQTLMRTGAHAEKQTHTCAIVRLQWAKAAQATGYFLVLGEGERATWTPALRSWSCEDRSANHLIMWTLGSAGFAASTSFISFVTRRSRPCLAT